MPYLIISDFIVFLHFLWIIFLIFGAFIGRRYKWVKRVHIAGVGFALVMQGFGWYCPLTYLETWLRRMHNPSQSYSGSFIINYVQKIVYIELPANIILIMTVLLAMMSAWVYLHRPKETKP